MSCYEEVITLDEENLAKKTPEYQAKLRKYSEVLQESRKTIVNSKIKLGYGTDFIVVYQNYESWREYATMLKSGIDPFRALKAATSVNAEILNQPDLGVLAVGKLADIAAWKRDLLNDPEALSECAFVMKDGKIYNTVGGQQNSNKVIDYAG
jgi:imidazolonepropionase-like amidohydrolase